MNILKAGRKHLPLLVPLFDAYRQFYRQAPNVAAAENFLHQRLVDGDSVIFLALGESGSPLGFVQLYPSFSSVSMKRIWILNDLFVIPEGRKQGVAEGLMKRSEQLAKETQAKELVLETARDNLPAQALYRKLGWKQEQEFDRYFLSIS